MNSDEDRMVLLGVLVLAFTLAVPAMTMRWLHAVTDWLLAHHLLVGAEHAAITIPGAAAGLDVRRVIVVLLLAPVVVFGVARAARLVRRRRPVDRPGPSRGFLR